MYADDGTSTIYDIIPPSPTSEYRGGIIADAKTDNDTVEVKIGEDGKWYIPDNISVIDARFQDYDMDAILSSGSHYVIYKTNENTLNTLIKKESQYINCQ